MRRFILIDHSIKGFGGHHYEYAVHVLNAAQQAGFKTILAVNRDFKSSPNAAGEPWDIVPIYEHGFWRSAPPAPTTQSDGWRARLFDFKVRLKYGTLGKLFWTLPEFRGHYTPATIFEEYRGTPQLFLMLVGLLLIKYPYGVLQATHHLVRVVVSPFRDYMIKVASALVHLVVMILYPLRLFKHLWLFKSVFSSRKIEAHHEFGRDTGALFGRIGMEQGDTVFMPTLSEKDMLGLKEFLNSNPEAHIASWHLLFRRNLFDAPGPRNGLAMRPPIEAQAAFRQFHENLNGNVIRFYTDTDRLSQEYNCLGVARFHTLPIPINPDFVKRSVDPLQAKTPLRIVYAGDARTEKGYHHLPDLVRNLGSNGHADDVVFQIQSNMAQSRMEDGTAERLALQELELLNSGRITLYKAPLNSAEYFDLVSSADIVLILYDARNYYSRSSGILVEALAAGIPIVVPADSWMGQQLADANYAYLSNAETHAGVIDRHDEAWWPVIPSLGNASENGNGTTLSRHVYGGKESLLLRVPKGRPSHVLVRFERPHQENLEILVRTAQSSGDSPLTSSARLLHALPDYPQCTALFELHPDADSIAVDFIAMNQSNATSLSHLEAVFLREGRERLFSDVIGRAYLPSDDIGRHVKQLVEHYEHYRQTARDYAIRWNDRHSAARLVEELIK